MPRMYECRIELGSRRDGSLSFYWVKGVHWACDSIVVDLSADQCFVPLEIADSVSTLVSHAKNRPCKRYCVTCTEVNSSDDLDDSSLVEKYRALLHEFVRVYGRDRLLALMHGDLSALREEVPSNE